MPERYSILSFRFGCFEIKGVYCSLYVFVSSTSVVKNNGDILLVIFNRHKYISLDTFYIQSAIID